MPLFKKKTIQEKTLERLENFRKNFIPPQYNQVEILDYLVDDEVDLLVTISTRTDGKTFNYFGAILDLCINLPIGFAIYANHFTIRNRYADTIKELLEFFPCFDSTKFYIERTDDYLLCFYGESEIGIISDLNASDDLRYSSSLLRKFQLIIYDEFLKLSDGYNPNEDEQLKFIYESTDRNTEPRENKVLASPKVLLMGNAVNFDSPLLAKFNLYRILEKHEINTSKKYGNKVVEMRHNINANERRNTRLFESKDDAMSTGKFEFNSFSLIDDNERQKIKQNYNDIIVNLDSDKALKIRYNIDNNMTVLSIINKTETYDYCMSVHDVKEDIKFLKESYFSETQIKKHIKGLYYYENAFSRNYITNNERLMSLKISRLRGEKNYHNTETIFDRNERVYNEQQFENAKKQIAKKYEFQTF